MGWGELVVPGWVWICGLSWPGRGAEGGTCPRWFADMFAWISKDQFGTVRAIYFYDNPRSHRDSTTSLQAVSQHPKLPHSFVTKTPYVITTQKSTKKNKSITDTIKPHISLHFTSLLPEAKMFYPTQLFPLSKCTRLDMPENCLK